VPYVAIAPPYRVQSTNGVLGKLGR
jgi:hypothetical protein